MRFCLFVLLFFIGSTTWAKSLVVTNYPVYLIAKEVTQGIEQPQLILSSNQTGHDAQLKPSDLQHIHQADLILWFGESNQPMLTKPLRQHPRALSWFSFKLLDIKPKRDLANQPIANSIDPHVWLDPMNAVRMAFFIAEMRAWAYPENKQRYLNNASRFAATLLNSVYRQTNTRPVIRSYWAYHDAYQYLEPWLKLNFAGALTNDPHSAPTVARYQLVKQSKTQLSVCLVAEGSISQNMLNYLKPVRFEQINELLLNHSSFTQGWLLIATQINRCVA